MNDSERSRLDLLLDLLSDEVAKRLQERTKSQRAPSESLQHAVRPIPADALVPKATPAPAAEPVPETAPIQTAASISSKSLMTRMTLGVLLVVILINIPFNAQGTALARSIPNSASLVIMNGLLVKEENSPDVWVFRNDAFHWITSLDAFEHYGYRWQNVHVVEPGFLNQFEKGSPIYVLLKCDASPHIYRLEDGRKRWIVDIPTFQAEGYVWQDVKMVPCTYLRGLPDGDSVPPGRGKPSPPLP